jgi:hypothetical protein
MVIANGERERRYNVDSSVTSCLKVRIASRKSSFFHFKQAFSYGSALVSPPRTQLCSSALEQ